MFVLTLACVFVALIIPVAAWALATKSTVAGLTLAAALLTCGVGWFSLVVGWTREDQVANTVLVLTLATPALIMAGRLASQTAGVSAIAPARVRLISGPFLAAACACLNIVVFVVLIFAALYLGLGYTPPSSDVLPLPSALTLVSDQDHGCRAGLLGSCVREIDIKSTAGASTERTARLVNKALARLHGWQLGPAQNSCRREGWVLGREDVCIEVQTNQDAVQVLLRSMP